MSDFSFSVIVNTYNRARSLVSTLDALANLIYPNFEVVVINGPSTDSTAEVLADYSDVVKVGSCPVPNLAQSRNCGIRMAGGDLVAFTDDDAVPEPEWLSALAAGYDDEMVGAVGGMVYDDSGHDFQARYILCDRSGSSSFPKEDPSRLYNFPQSERYCAPMGTNSSFRREALVAIGGFDEEYAYFLEETDACVRMVDAGYIVKFSASAYVHHKFLTNAIRGKNRVAVDRYQIMKNIVYFGLVNRPEGRSDKDVLSSIAPNLDTHHEQMKFHFENGDITAEQFSKFESDLTLALREGLARGLNGSRKFGQFAGSPPLMKHCEVKTPPGGRLCICFLSQQYKPTVTGGIGRFTADLAEAIASQGHIVHVITVGQDSSRVDLESGVWVHRIVLTDDVAPVPSSGPRVADHHWRLSMTLHKELERIDSHHRIDLVQAPLWDVENIAPLLLGTWPIVTSLNSSFQTVLDTKPEWLSDPSFMKNIGEKWINCEKYVLEQSTGVFAISEAVIKTVEAEHSLELDRSRVGVVHLGLMDESNASVSAPSSGGDEQVEILFVGRLEARKGISDLLATLPGLLAMYSALHVTIVGDDTLEDDHGQTVRSEFTAAHSSEPWFGRVNFTGQIGSDELNQRFAECDLFVAPSTYESFGLVYVEAMMHGKPVVACNTGGVPEVVDHERTGFLVSPNAPDPLGHAISRLVEDRDLREKMGAAGRLRFTERFSARAMGERAIDYYRTVLADHARLT